MSQGAECEVRIDESGTCTLMVWTEAGTPASVALPFAATMRLRDLFNQAVIQGPSRNSVVRFDGERV